MSIDFSLSPELEAIRQKTRDFIDNVVERATGTIRGRAQFANADGMFEPEYAEVYGVPFSFIPTVTVIKVPVQRPVHRVRGAGSRRRSRCASSCRAWRESL